VVCFFFERTENVRFWRAIPKTGQFTAQQRIDGAPAR